MRSILKIGTILVMAGFLSCSDDELRTYDSLQQKDAVESVNDPFLLASIIRKTSIFYQKMGYDNRTLPGAVQHMESNYQSGDNFYSAFKSPVNDMYTAMEILKLIDGSIGLAKTRESKTHEGIFKIFRVLLFSYMTDFYGDVYYSEALKAREGILYPKYDAQTTIYAGLLKELDEANALMAAGTEPVSESYDLMFAGDKLQWQKFSNSLKWRLLMRASAKLPDAGTKMSALLNEPVFTEPTDNASISYIGTVGGENGNAWTGGPLNWGTIDNFDTRRPAKTLVDKLTELNDPRMPVWFAPVENPWTSDIAKNGVNFTTTDPNGYTYTSKWEYINRKNKDIAAYATKEILLDSNKVYVGFIAGMLADWKNGNGHYDVAAGGTVGNFKVSKFSKLFREDKHPLLKAMIMNSDEIQFILAEAAAKGLIAGSVDAYYRKGITNSLVRWGVTPDLVSKYLAQPVIALPTDKAGQLSKIADQKWIALFLVSSEGYLDLRRTRLPAIFSNGRLSGFPFPERYRYPGGELGQNKAAYDLGVSALTPSVDDQFSRMWLLTK